MTSDKSEKILSPKSIVNYFISFLLAGVFLYIAFHDVSFSEVLKITGEANIFWMIIFIILFYLGHIIRAYRWKYILNSVKPDTKFSHLLGSLMIGYGVNCITPKLGEVTRAVLFGKWEGLSRSSMFGTVILERIIDIIALAVSVLIALVVPTENIRDSFPWLMTTLYITSALIILFILFLYLILKYKEKFSGWVVTLLNRFSHSLADKVSYIISMLTQGFFSLKGRKNFYITFLLSALIIIVYATTSYVGLLMLNMQHIQPVTFTMGWVLMSISSIGVIIPTPGSTGSYHTLAKSTLVLLYGFGETVSAAYAFLTHIISYILFIFSALVIYFVFYKKSVEITEISKRPTEEL